MRDIQLKDAKATLSAVIDDALRGEAFAITRHGQREAVIISWQHWERLSKVPSFGQVLTMAPPAIAELDARDDTPSRQFEF